MWSVLFVVCTLLPSLMCKESASSVGLVDDENTVLSRAVKRSVKDSFSKASHPKRDRDDRDQAGCGNLIVNNGTIINTEQSILNGSVFLEAFRNVDSNQACVDHCCKNSSCDTAVFENKDERRCFLFHCHAKCSFSHHTSYQYISSMITRRLSAPALQPIADAGSDAKEDDNNNNQNISDKEDSAADNGKSSESVRPKEENTKTSSAPFTATSSEPAITVANILPHSGEVCPVGSFQCQNPADGEIQCIALEKVCDSVKQCSDGSDEYTCVDSEKQGQLDTEKEGKSKEKQSSEEQLSSSSEEEEKSGKNQPSSEEKTQSSAEKKNQHPSEEKNEPSSEEKNQQPSEEKNQPSSEEKTQSSAEEKNQQPSEEKTQPSSEEENQSSAEEENHPGSDKESGEASSGGAIHEKNPINSDEVAINSTYPAEDKLATDVLTTTVPQGNFISREKVPQPSRGSNLQVPIIALSVGLAFTLVLLVFVACRLCKVRRQLRKGRPLHCNEADYLINGMYL